MARLETLALVLAGGEGGRLGALTERRAKPALPFAGVYRLIDFPLSNCLHSGISDVWVIQQYQPHSLNEHLANGRPWDLDRTHGGLRVVAPYLGESESGWYEGNADAIYRNKTELERQAPELLLVLSADHVYTLDYGQVIAAHREREAVVTMVTTELPRAEAGRFGVVEADGDGRVTGFEYKPEEPRTGLVATEVFVYTTAALLDALEELAEGDEDTGLEDFGDALVPRLVDEGRAYEYRLDGYWRDVGTIESYWGAHMQLLEAEPALRLDDPDWPILTNTVVRPPARIEWSASIAESWIAPGCVVRGTVERSVLSPGVVVEEGATVRESIVFHDGVVGAGVELVRTILDSDGRSETVRPGE